MHALPAYERDPFLTRLDTRVLALGESGGRTYALLADTVCYPEGGGQPADRGLLNAVPVVDVQKGADGIRHFLKAPVEVGPATLELDWARRFDHMQQHTGQHLLTAVAQDRFGWQTTAFHLGDERCDIELATPSLEPQDLCRLEAFVAAEIRAARPVKAEWVSAEEYRERKVRSRGLPEGHQGDIRLVGIEGLDLNTCGGTHLRSTAELEALALLGQEPIRGGMRLFFVAGERLRRRLAEHEQRNALLRTRLGAPDSELTGALETKLEQLQAAQRQVRHLEEDLCALMVEVLAVQPEAILDRHFEGRDAAFLQKLGRGMQQAAPHKAALFTAELDGRLAFLVLAGPESPVAVASVGPVIATLLEGRGGGSNGLFQGKAGSLSRRVEALAKLHE